MHVPNPPPFRPIVPNENYTLVNQKGVWQMIDKKDEKKVHSAPTFSANDIVFQLFRQQHSDKPQNLTLNDFKLLIDINFEAHLPTRIVIHGWNQRNGLMEQFATAYFTKGNPKLNFIGVIWQKGSNLIPYSTARENVKIVGAHVALFIDFLIKAEIKAEKLALIGHSMGAHAMAIG